MPHLDLRPTSDIIRNYYDSLGRPSGPYATHESAVRAAFSTLLDACARKFDWTLVNEYELRREKKFLRIDGALVNPWSLPYGFWQAKDEDDDLAVVVRKKLDLGYPTRNIVFQAPDRAILYQDGRRILDEHIGPDRKEALIEVVQEFFRYEPPQYKEWEKAVANFKDRIPQLARSLEEHIEKERRDPRFESAFTQFARVCRTSLNPRLTDGAVEKMLVQHILTERIFRKVFANPDFFRRNPIAVEIEKVVDQFTARTFNRAQFLADLDQFYAAFERAAGTLEDYSEKQHFLNKVYESFFKRFDEKTADTHGIVYTPQPIVRFMVRSVDELLKREFGKSLSDKGVHVLDPFTGTGNFLLSVMRNIQHTHEIRLPYKYAHELHANEVMLLPYYIASMNIEHEYAELADEYRPFEGLCLVDTFELAESAQGSFPIIAQGNTERIEAQKKMPITVIIGNPPYNAWQVNENDGNRNRKYEAVDARVARTYAAASRARLVNSLSDPYVKAFRWASDRLGDEGILTYVSNNSYVSELAFDGMRAHLAKDFDAIYILDLGGNVRKNPKLSGTTNNVFGIQVGVAIGFFVRRRGEKAGQRRAEIFYARTDEDWRKERKYKLLDDVGTAMKIEWQRIKPDERNTWLTEGLRADFDSFLPLTGKTNKGKEPQALFSLASNGLKSNNDAYVFGFQQTEVSKRAKAMTEAYNAELSRWRASRKKETVDTFIRVDERVLKWIHETKQFLARNQEAVFHNASIRAAIYRPFTRQWHFFDRMFNNRLYLLPSIPWEHSAKDRAICVPGAGNRQRFGAFIVDNIAALDLAFEKANLLPLRRFDDSGAIQDNITDWALKKFQGYYKSPEITKWAIFHYIYALLHHPDYQTQYEANLKRELPRIPFASNFWGFAEAGERLAELHLHYEKQPSYPLKYITKGGSEPDWRVEKMRFAPNDRTRLIYNDSLTLVGIPPEVFEYRIGNRPALEWVIDQYQVSTDNRSGIMNDPNRPDDQEYVLRLIGQVITVSLETVKIVRSLPPLDIAAPTARAGSTIVPVTELDERVAELKTLGKGWYEPDTPAPDARALDQLAQFVTAALSHAGLDEPFLYATLDGGAQAEWPLTSWEVVARVAPTAKNVEVQASSLTGRGWRRIEIPLADVNTTATTFAEFVSSLDAPEENSHAS